MTTHKVEMEIKVSDTHEECCGFGCPAVMISRFGTIYHCRYFSESIGAGGGDELHMDMNKGVWRHEKCLEAVPLKGKNDEGWKEISQNSDRVPKEPGEEKHYHDGVL